MYLSQCLDSIIRQTLKEIEIICVDDGSTDKTMDILEEYQRRDQRIRILKQKNSFAGVARNYGLSIATGKYIVFLDSDDFFEPDMLEIMYGKCEKEMADICLCGADKYDTVSGTFQQAPWLLNLNFAITQPFNCSSVNNIYGITAPNPWTKMFSLDFIKVNNLKFQNLQRANDCFFVFSALALANRIVAVDKVLVHYRVGQTTNLQATIASTPTLFCDALLAVKERLIQENIYEKVEQSFLNAAICQIQYNLSRLTSDTSGYEKLVNQLKKHYMNELDFSNYLPGFHGGAKEYAYVMNALSKISDEKIFVEVSKPKISILIPVYNTSTFLRCCLDSVVNQTLQDIEIVCVNDGSTDISPQILQEYAEHDLRLKVITQKNAGLFMARKVAVEYSTGQYIMFLDSDDYLEINTCEELYNTITSKNVDIVQFGTLVDATPEVSIERISNLEKLLRPCTDLIYGSILESAFKEKKFRFSLWNKIYRAEIVKKAYSQMPEDQIFKAEDLYAFFIISFFSKSYFGIDNQYYHYRFGSGLTGKNVINIDVFSTICKQNLVAKRIGEFLHSKKAFLRYYELYESIYIDLLNEVLGNWQNYLVSAFQKEAFLMILDSWDKEYILTVLAKRFGSCPHGLAEILNDASILACDKKSISTVGIFYPRLTMGGVQRVIALLIPMYIEQGYKVVLFTEEKAVQEEYEVHESVERVIIPSSASREERSRKLFMLLKEYQVDVFIHHATSSPVLLFDILAAKMQGIPVIAVIHEVFVAQINRLGAAAAYKYKIYKMADCTLTLSKVQASFWQTLGVNAKFILNPLTYNYDAGYEPNLSTHNIVWVGRIADEKNCDDAIRILAKVQNVFQDAKLIIVGDAIDGEKKENLLKLIDYYKVNENVEFAGFTENVAEYYRKSSVYLMTSLVESFSMTLAESKFFGLPAVVYELPYIDLSAENYGTISVPQFDIVKAASAIIELFSKTDYMKEQSTLSLKCAKTLSLYDLRSAWEDVFNEIVGCRNSTKETVVGIHDLKISIESLLFSYSLACKKYAELQQKVTKISKDKAELGKKQEKLNQELKKYKNKVNQLDMKSYHVGRIVTFIPRKLRGGIYCWRDHGISYTLKLFIKKVISHFK